MVNFIHLGGTLFIPATHKDLEYIVSGEKYRNLKSVAIDTEDAIAENDVKKALQSIKSLLENFVKTELIVFIRPRNISVFKEILEDENIDKIDGFILPKFSLDNTDEYLEIAQNTKHFIMPSIEGKELFDGEKLIQLREKLLPFKEKIILVRFGLEDMLRQLKMRRTCKESIFDFSVTSSVLGNFIAVFKSAGFEVSGGVYPCFKDFEGFEKDVLRDLKEGLFSKTIIHPQQIEIINELYKVSQTQYDEAQEILLSTKNIFSQNNKMAEITTMQPYSQFIVDRGKFYGVN